MLDVFFTVDVELWCDGWNDLDNKFADAYRKYIYGTTAKGQFGLPYQLKLLNDHGLLGVFFVEPLFATRFGIEPLHELVGLIEQAKQETQMHLHTEWVDESDPPILTNSTHKRQHLFHFTVQEQTELLSIGLELLRQSGAGSINAFRAGNFGFNRDTLRALAANRIAFDCSYNQLMHGPQSGVSPNQALCEPIECEGVFEYPMTYFTDGMGRLRHVQLGACSFAEIERLLWQALEQERQSFVILFHNFELLNRSLSQPDPIVIKRFQQLCQFLDRNRDQFQTRGFRTLQAKPTAGQATPLNTSPWQTGRRIYEQLIRRTYA